VNELSEIGLRVKGLREQSGLTQESLAVKCRMQQSAISHLESGRRMPSAVVVVRLCKALGCRSDYLLGLPVEREEP